MATTRSDGHPHLVPIVFAVAEETIFTCVDDKPKTTRRLRRLDNIAATGRVSVLVDHYEDDWSALWWIRADCSAAILDPADPLARSGLRSLAAKYPQYAESPPPGPVVALRPTGWRSWSARQW
jgi:PPOX class probable F420-dependent enzyme